MSLSRDQLEALSLRHPRDPILPAELDPALASKPFIPAAPSALLNLRDIGLGPGSAVREGLAYRSAALEAASKDPKSGAWLSSHVKRVFDLRTKTERTAAPEPQFDGIESTWIQGTREDAKPVLEDYVEGWGEKGFEAEYLRLLEIYAPAFKVVLEHVRDRPGEPFLFHCAAGRDRTGVLAGLLEALAGTPAEDVRLDYVISRIGVEPGRALMLKYAQVSTDTGSDEAPPGFWNMCSLRPESWDAFVGGLEREHGGWDGYVTKHLGLSQADLDQVKANLRR